MDTYYYVSTPFSITLPQKYADGQNMTVPVSRCIPCMETNVIMLYAMGNTTKVVYRPVCVAPGVDTHHVHAYNVASGWALPDERTQDERQAESIRTSISRSVRMVRELAACNPWQFFVTITLSPANWQNRYTPDGLQDVIKAMTRRWRRKHKDGSAYCPDFKYLLIPEMHKNGAIHLHGFVNHMPPAECIPYTMADVNSSKQLPKKICDKVRAGETIYHSPTWEKLFGYNTFEPISDLDKASSYVVKYVSKEIGSTPFKMRYWSSRKLSRATRIATYYFPDSSDYSQQLNDYNDYMLSVAAVTKAKHAMHQESFVPIRDRKKKDSESQTLMNITTYVNGCDHSSSEILEHMDSVYDATPHYIEIRPDALISPEEVAQSQLRLNFAHTRLIAKKLTEECITTQNDEASGHLEWIDYKPFLTLAKDDPRAKHFRSSSPDIYKGSQLSMFDLVSKKILSQRSTNYEYFNQN